MNDTPVQDFCGDNNISCSNCIHLIDIMGGIAVPVYSCKFMFAGGSYSGSYAKHDINTFACVHYENNLIQG